MNRLKPETKKILALIISSIIFITLFTVIFIKLNTGDSGKSGGETAETAVGGYADTRNTDLSPETDSDGTISETSLESGGTVSDTAESYTVSVSDTAADETEADKFQHNIPEKLNTDEDDPMYSLLEDYGFSRDALGDSEQLILVESDGSKCLVTLYEKNESWYTLKMCTGTVGENGVSRNSSEGDYCTPYGLYSLGFAFGTDELSGLNVEYRRFNENCYWVDDPESDLYNRWVETDSPSWNSAEHLSDYPDAYHYAMVINYNMHPVVPGAGSAIFLHCAYGDSTAGCVAVPEEQMLDILRWADSQKSPLILIV